MSRNTWEDLHDGDHRLFSVLKLDVVGHSQITRNHSPSQTRDTFDALREQVDRAVAGRNGRMWGWQGDGGLIAFYEDPDTLAEDAVRCGMEVIEGLEAFNRETSQIEAEVRLRAAAHIGVIEYREDKGNIHSDVINFVSHLEADKGKTLPNTLSASEDVVSRLSEIKGLFSGNGDFEGRVVYTTASLKDIVSAQRARRAPSPNAGAPGGPPAGERAPGRPVPKSQKCVLVVDDSPMTRKVVCMIIRGLGYRAEEAADGIEGLRVARSVLPDLIILDVVMPKMGGVEALREIRADRSLRMTPVLMLTGYSDETTVREAIAGHIRGYILKDRPLEMKKKLEEYLAEV